MQGTRQGCPYQTRSGPPGPCMVGAGLAPALKVGLKSAPMRATLASALRWVGTLTFTPIGSTLAVALRRVGRRAGIVCIESESDTSDER